MVATATVARHATGRRLDTHQKDQRHTLSRCVSSAGVRPVPLIVNHQLDKFSSHVQIMPTHHKDTLNTHTMEPKIIAHMPGAGGNFLCRVLEQGRQSGRFMHEAAYDHDPRTRARHTQSLEEWVDFELTWRSPRYSQGHYRTPAWLRITVETPKEWDWSCANALWKNSHLGENSCLASDPALSAQHHIRLRDLWTWPTLASELERIQGSAANTNQRIMWQQWCSTHCPDPYSPTWQRISESRWGHLRPEWCRHTTKTQ